jgi:hypothetical protein
MRIVRIFVFAAATLALCAWASAGVLEKASKIQVDPTVVEHAEKVDDNLAANLVRYNLRAAIRDAHLEEGASPIRVHMVLDEFSSESPARRVIGAGTGRNVCTVNGTLVFEDAAGRELATVKIHVRGSVVSAQGDGGNADGRQVTSDLERRFLEEIEKLK